MCHFKAACCILYDRRKWSHLFWVSTGDYLWWIFWGFCVQNQNLVIFLKTAPVYISEYIAKFGGGGLFSVFRTSDPESASKTKSSIWNQHPKLKVQFQRGAVFGTSDLESASKTKSSISGKGGGAVFRTSDLESASKTERLKISPAVFIGFSPRNEEAEENFATSTISTCFTQLINSSRIDLFWSFLNYVKTSKVKLPLPQCFNLHTHVTCQKKRSLNKIYSHFVTVHCQLKSEILRLNRTNNHMQMWSSYNVIRESEKFPLKISRWIEHLLISILNCFLLPLVNSHFSPLFNLHLSWPLNLLLSYMKGIVFVLKNYQVRLCAHIVSLYSVFFW